VATAVRNGRGRRDDSSRLRARGACCASPRSV
jgi:hypothetical protein